MIQQVKDEKDGLVTGEHFMPVKGIRSEALVSIATIRDMCSDSAACDTNPRAWCRHIGTNELSGLDASDKTVRRWKLDMMRKTHPDKVQNLGVFYDAQAAKAFAEYIEKMLLYILK